MRLLSTVFILALSGCAPGGDAPKDDGTPDGGDDTGGDDAPRLGLLQFALRQNLDDESCLARGDCSLQIEEVDDVEGWVATLADDVSEPVLHWDRGVPWSAFAVPPPDDADPVAFYEGRLDPALLAWIQVYGAWFRAEGRGYLALADLGGARSALAPELLADGTQVDLSGACPDLGYDAEYVAVDGTSFVLGPAWQRWVSFLAAELQPDQLALSVEANLFLAACPARWSSLVERYHATYDATRAELGDDVRLFATLSLPPLLGYDGACVPDLAFAACGGAVPDAPAFDPEACFPGEPTALDDLAAGGRMDVLALSFYPDGLGTTQPDAPDGRMRVWFEGTDPAGECDYEARLPAWVDPLPYVDRLGWTGPVGWAETSSRSCPTLQWWDDGTTAAAVELPGSDAGQSAWLAELLERRDDWAFVHQSFARDYAPLGLWVVDDGVVSADVYNLFNAWPCSGIRDEDGVVKPAGEVWRAALP